MAAQPEYYTGQIADATKAIAALMREREQVVKDLEAASAARLKGETPEAKRMRLERLHADAHERLAGLEHKAEQERRRERQARTTLAAANRQLDMTLARIESDAYRRRRPPAGQGPPLLTEAEYRRAQNSVPPWAFLATVAAITAVAALAVTAGEVPNWVTILFAVAGLVIPIALGLRANHLAKEGNAISQRALEVQLSSLSLKHSPDGTHGSTPAVEDDRKPIATTPDNGMALRKRRTNQASTASSFRTTPPAPDEDVDKSHLGHQAGVVSQEDAEMLQGQLSSDQQSPIPPTSAGLANPSPVERERSDLGNTTG